MPKTRVLLALAIVNAGCSLESAGTSVDPTLESGIEGQDSSSTDTSFAGTDSATVDSGSEDSSAPLDSDLVDSAPLDTGVIDTDVIDTGVIDTGPPDMGVVMPSLSGTIGALPSNNVNLATEGTLGWGHWGHGGADNFNGKAGSTAINKGTIGTPLWYGIYSTRFSWTGGSPTASASESRQGIYHDKKNESFTFEAAGDPFTERTLRVYVAFDDSTGKIEASLSDATPTWSQSFGGDSSEILPRVVELKFRPATAAGKVVVKVIKSKESGYLSLLAATLKWTILR